MPRVRAGSTTRRARTEELLDQDCLLGRAARSVVHSDGVLITASYSHQIRPTCAALHDAGDAHRSENSDRLASSVRDQLQTGRSTHVVWLRTTLQATPTIQRPLPTRRIVDIDQYRVHCSSNAGDTLIIYPAAAPPHARRGLNWRVDYMDGQHCDSSWSSPLRSQLGRSSTPGTQ